MKILLRDRDGNPLPVDGKIYGDFAAHKAVDTRGFSVSHVPTGMRVLGDIKKMAAAAEVARLFASDPALSANMAALEDRQIDFIVEVKRALRASGHLLERRTPRRRGK